MSCSIATAGIGDEAVTAALRAPPHFRQKLASTVFPRDVVNGYYVQQTGVVRLRTRASSRWPCVASSRARLVVARNSNDLPLC